MAQQPSASIENNFTAGLKTEFTGLNFPENAATDADNVVFEYLGNVRRRYGFDFETNGVTSFGEASGQKAISTYLWTNAGGDGNTQLLVQQFGIWLKFYRVTAATVASPLSTKLLVSAVDLTTFLVSGSSRTIPDIECQFSDGNGYLFVYHPSCEPFYCTFDPTALTVTGNGISIKTRDFDGISEGAGQEKIRPLTLTSTHQYNLQNQGWTSGGAWTATSTTLMYNVSPIASGTFAYTIAAGLTITPGTVVNMVETTFYSPGGQGSYLLGRGIVVSYSGTTLTMTVTPQGGMPPGGNTPMFWTFTPVNIGYINKWFTDTGRYPSNADVWWNFKNASDVFDPAGTIANVTLSSPAPKGSFLLNPFYQDRVGASGVSGLYLLQTNVRPRTGTWFQGRVWYAGVDAYQSEVTSTSPFYTWTENIYFSQIVQTPDQFGLCYQTNDPTSEELFNLLPTDGGVIKIQGIGAIYKLFPIQNGMLVFGANGIWFITGSQGIGFTANDYTITKISNIRSLSSTSFVNVQGLPYFWNEEGVYTVTPAQQGLGLQVQSLTYNTIDSFYAEIPVSSKQAARGDYNPIDYIVQWVYRDTPASTVQGKTHFNKVLCFNTQTKAFYTYTLPSGSIHVNGINYIPDYGSDSPTGTFKYLTSNVVSSVNYFTFSEETDEDYVDWSASGAPVDYTSYFQTGYKIRGQAQRRWQPGSVYMFSDVTDPVTYRIQGQYDYAISGDAGRWSSNQLISINEPDYNMAFRRHRLRGRGLVMQIKVTSVEGEPFNFIGWSIWETSNTGV